MDHDMVYTDGAPRPIGPYSQGMRFERLLFTAGQIALEPDGTIAEGGAAAEARVALRNLRNVLEAGGASLATVLKTTIFLKDMEDFAAVNEIYGEAFAGHAPARSTVEVSRLPRDARVEIEAIAYIP